MSEEKPNIKINDRRLFNPDGTPREGVIEEREAERAKAAEAAAAAAPPPPQSASSAPRREEAAPPTAAPAEGQEAPPASAPEEEEDPQEFMMLVEFIASFAAESLGMATHPGAAGAPPQVNLPLARQCIDMLGTLERKTHGNLGAEESRFLDLILSQLRMHYVQLSKQRQPGGGGPAPRNFTGGDITGGR